MALDMEDGWVAVIPGGRRALFLEAEKIIPVAQIEKRLTDSEAPKSHVQRVRT